MELLLERKFLNEDSTEGNLYVNSKWFAHVIEDRVRAKPGAWRKSVKVWGRTAIPYGRYPVRVTWSNRFRRLLTGIFEVPSFDGIRIHNGTSHLSSAGCPIISYKNDDEHNMNQVFNEPAAMNDLCKMVLEVQDTEEVWIDIIDKKPF